MEWSLLTEGQIAMLLNQVPTERQRVDAGDRISMTLENDRYAHLTRGLFIVGRLDLYPDLEGEFCYYLASDEHLSAQRDILQEFSGSLHGKHNSGLFNAIYAYLLIHARKSPSSAL